MRISKAYLFILTSIKINKLKIVYSLRMLRRSKLIYQCISYIIYIKTELTQPRAGSPAYAPQAQPLPNGGVGVWCRLRMDRLLCMFGSYAIV